jgi:hypothetical protein
MLKNIQAWKSTILGIVAVLGVLGLVYTGKLSENFLIVIVPALIPVFTDWFKEHKKEDEA